MSASLKPRMIPDGATLDLWRVAETGDVAELARILPRITNVNARNKYGMTALMRAAYHGHERMVLALLDHGADPNLARNDKFTALALAAFFGHTDTVRILIEHGAKPEVVTRCGASAHMWARARTFDEAARCLETHTTARAPAVVKTIKKSPEILRSVVQQDAPAREPLAVKKLKDPPEIRSVVQQHVSAREPLAVKKLKDPPEIWDLVQVQEVPKNFNARSAFLSRLQSLHGSLALRLAALCLVAAACVVGAWVLRGSSTRNLQAEVPTVSAETKVTPTETVEKPVATEPSVTASATEVDELPAVDAVRNHGTRKVRSREPRVRSTVVEDVVETAPSREVVPAAPVIAPPRTESRSSDKPNSSLSPQLITPAKTGAPKAKVIQWP